MTEEEYKEKTIRYLQPVMVEKVNLDRIGYFDAPASSSHHLAERGGLVKHSINVTDWLLKLTATLGVDWPRCGSPYIVGMLHDVVKAMCYKFQKNGDDEYEKIVRCPHPYSGHGEASVAIIGSELGLQLYPMEASAIMHHMGAFHLEGNSLKDYDRALSIYPKAIIATHTADMMAARVDEEYDHENLR